MKRPQAEAFPAVVSPEARPAVLPAPVPVPVTASPSVAGRPVTAPGWAPAEKKMPAHSFLKTPWGNSASARFQ